MAPQNQALISLDLSKNELSRHLSPELNNFRNIDSLDLSNNNFEGDIPNNLPETLNVFNVSERLLGMSPSKLLLERSRESMFRKLFNSGDKCLDSSFFDKSSDIRAWF
ncbi:hypothetical protein DM860_006098 [Cuscuta australis]|uniref:Leucine-rich repeat-containing N-terminal plant-type domain-containing protein n=1 Tax=Cuscuta australis TaxID=267555 RepID=A0A328DK67_9ASTE|nr:hypothetical protein DM860_006098 [Cuscuta australis]